VLFRRATLPPTRFGDGEDLIVLASSVEAARLRLDAGWQELSARDALWHFDSMERWASSSIRDFVGEASLSSFPLSSVRDHELTEIVRRGIRDGSVVALRQGDAAEAPSATVEWRRLVKEIEKEARGRLAFAGRQCKLVADADLSSLPDRNSYEVVGRDEAQKILTSLANEQGMPAELLTRARGKLSKDWRPPISEADGLVLLRRNLPPRTAPSKDEPAITPSQMQELLTKKKKVISIAWTVASAWCSEDVAAEGNTENYATGDSIDVKFQQQGGSQHQSTSAKVSADSFRVPWTIKDILPPKQGEHLGPELKMDATADGKTSPKPLAIKFVTHLNKVAHVKDRTHFELSLTDSVVLVESDIKYVQGWGGEVVKLGNKVPAGTGGLLDGQLAWPGYRWMKNAGLIKKFWDGTDWQSLPAGFVLADSNNFAVGFYKQGASFTCQYGGSWPANFTDWNIEAADKQSTITAWSSNIKTTWTGKFDFKHKECKSGDKKCCRYSTKAAVTFSKQATFSSGMLIIADGNIRSNDSLLFLGETRIAVAAHEFGHHLGNPDEYAGAAIDTTLNSDGAANGIDTDSIMGQNLTKVKARHFREICKVFTEAVANAFGKTYNYLVLPP
jgi:hypothetical protein